jgi:hypothetical protein
MKLAKGNEQRDVVIKEELPEDDPVTGRFFNIREVRPGLKVWKNPDNGFTVARLHYSVDPAKRTPEWKKAARSGITFAEWMREYEIQWSSFDGVPVYGDDFSRSFHVSDKLLEWQRGYPVVRGWDFGLGAGGMACLFGQLLPQMRLAIYREITAGDTDIEHFAPEVQRLSSEWFPQCVKFFDVIDPTGFNRSQINKKSCAQVVRDSCFAEPQPGDTSKIARRKSVTKFLQKAIRGMPGLLISSEGCPVTVAGFEGGYHYPVAKDGQLKEDPEKNIYSHPHDALQMIAGKVEKLELFSAAGPSNVRQPSYNFGR